MKKLQTLSEMTEGMNEFQKFLFFSEKQKEREEFRKIFWSLYLDGGMDCDEMQKDMRISRVAWNRYYNGDMPLPNGLLFRIKNRYKDKIKAVEYLQRKRSLDEYFNYLRAPIPKSEDIQQSGESMLPETSCTPTEANPIPSPENALA
ncbi:hypothetical protein [Chitinophaga cymbidii]|uniref:Uncharacterized protein n=1 Tax=Chitinophaga cymbidii TaxID=1096750 RepID=A0A512RIM1_9BACT|nr:hypothetical protein [Chitinophaga cymbidii]GEP95543.1 hypothetical protein CCY01nite_18030 [Chitinophaga cymbidii]